MKLKKKKSRVKVGSQTQQDLRKKQRPGLCWFQEPYLKQSKVGSRKARMGRVARADANQKKQGWQHSR